MLTRVKSMYVVYDTPSADSETEAEKGTELYGELVRQKIAPQRFHLVTS